MSVVCLVCQVSEAIQLGALALKENRTDVEKVQMCLQELDEFRDSQEIIHNALGEWIA